MLGVGPTCLLRAGDHCREGTANPVLQRMASEGQVRFEPRLNVLCIKLYDLSSHSHPEASPAMSLIIGSSPTSPSPHSLSTLGQHRPASFTTGPIGFSQVTAVDENIDESQHLYKGDASLG